MKVMKTRDPVIRAIPVRVTPVAAAVATALGSFCGISLAADDTATERNASALTGTDEIVVTATRRDTSLQDVPYNLSALSDADIEALQIRDLSDISRWTPGLIQVDQGARDANRLIMRGLNASSIDAPEFLRNSQGDRVSTYYGEVPIYIDLKPIDLDRVEVLRGPQGTLYGTRSLGGTLRYIPKQPELNEFTVDANGRSYGMSESDDLGYDGSIVINAPLIQDTLALRAMLGYLHKPGFIDQNYLINEAGASCPEPFFVDPDDGCTPDDLHSKKDTNDEKTKSARLALLWNVSESLDATLSWQYQDQDIGGRQINTVDSMAFIDTDTVTPGLQPLRTGKYDNGLRFLEENDRENNIWNLTLNYAAPDFEIVSSTSYTTYEDKGNRDQTDLLLWYYYGDFPAFSAYTDDHTDDDFFTQEIRVVSTNTESDWDWVAGGFYQDSDQHQSSTEIAPGYDAYQGTVNPSDAITFINTDRDTTEVAFFGELGYKITDKLHILGGLRWFDIDDDINASGDFYYDPPFLLDYVSEGGGDDSDMLFKASADYTFNEDMLGYLLFSQGTSLGGSNFAPGLTDDERFVDPESVNNYELGLRTTWLDNAVILNGSLFYMDWQDLQQDATAANGQQITVNGGDAESKGLELEMRASLSDYWSLGLGYAYTNAELSDDSFGQDGDRLPGTPEHQGNLQLAFDFPMNADMNINATYGMTSQSDVFTKIGDGDDCCRDFGESLSGFTVHSGSVGLFTETWDATLFADNIFNKYAETGVRLDTSYLGYDGGPSNFTLRRYFKNMITPRTIGIDFRYRFRGN
jgi:iron complex outermembrane receptor protein